MALTGVTAPAQLIAEGEAVNGHIYDPYYKSMSTEDDDLDSDRIWAEENESELLVDDEDGGSTTMRGGVSEILSARGASLNSEQVITVHQAPASNDGG
ncbi:unnamed protein product [Urochloa humidicola]